VDYKKKAFTQGDVAVHVDRVVKALEDSDVAGLVRRLHALDDAARKPTGRLPFALVEEVADMADARPVSISLEPWVPCEVGHLVLSDETARYWELSDFTVSNVFLMAGDRRDKPHQPLPLETFSIRFVQDDRLAAVQRFRSERVYPGGHIRLAFSPRERGAICPIRGVLWVETFWP
jgi:hypothetical protein